MLQVNKLKAICVTSGHAVFTINAFILSAAAPLSGVVRERLLDLVCFMFFKPSVLMEDNKSSADISLFFQVKQKYQS